MAPGWEVRRFCALQVVFEPLQIVLGGIEDRLGCLDLFGPAAVLELLVDGLGLLSSLRRSATSARKSAASNCAIGWPAVTDSPSSKNRFSTWPGILKLIGTSMASMLPETRRDSSLARSKCHAYQPPAPTATIKAAAGKISLLELFAFMGIASL